MTLVRWRFAALMLGALSLALSFCHLMELAPRLLWAPELWMAATVFGGLYSLFGTVGAVIDVGTLIAVVALAILTRSRPGGRLALAGAALFVLAHAAWWGFVFPMNARLAAWTAGPVPAEFLAVRNQWEYSHAAIAVLKLAGFAMLVSSALALPHGAASQTG